MPESVKNTEKEKENVDRKRERERAKREIKYFTGRLLYDDGEIIKNGTTATQVKHRKRM